MGTIRNRVRVIRVRGGLWLNGLAPDRAHYTASQAAVALLDEARILLRLAEQEAGAVLTTAEEGLALAPTVVSEEPQLTGDMRRRTDVGGVTCAACGCACSA